MATHSSLTGGPVSSVGHGHGVVIVVVVMTVFIVTSMSDNALKSEEAADDGQEAQLHDWS